MDMLRTLFQLRERSERIAGLGIAWIINLDQDRAIPLNDERVAGIVIHCLTTC